VTPAVTDCYTAMLYSLVVSGASKLVNHHRTNSALCACQLRYDTALINADVLSGASVFTLHNVSCRYIFLLTDGWRLM